MKCSKIPLLSGSFKEATDRKFLNLLFNDWVKVSNVRMVRDNQWDFILSMCLLRRYCGIPWKTYFFQGGSMQTEAGCAEHWFSGCCMVTVTWKLFCLSASFQYNHYLNCRSSDWAHSSNSTVSCKRHDTIYKYWYIQYYVYAYRYNLYPCFVWRLHCKSWLCQLNNSN